MSVVRNHESPSICLCMRQLGNMIATFEAVPYTQFQTIAEEYSGTVKQDSSVAELSNVPKSQYHSGAELVDGSSQVGSREVVSYIRLKGSEYQCQSDRMGCHSGVPFSAGDVVSSLKGFTYTHSLEL